MKKISTFIVALFLLLALAACAPRQSTQLQPTASQSSTVDLFSPAQKCSACHNNLKDQDGADLSYNALWKGSMHAGTSIDPYFLATVSHEDVSYPALKAAIEDICSTCHLPMARLTAKTAGQPTTFLGEGSANPSSPLHALYKDGVSCLVCHLIRADGLGTPASFSGGYQIDTQTPAGQRVLYGPFELDAAMKAIMQDSTNFNVQQSDHMGKSEFCATCHTLYTSPVDRDGKQSQVQFPEQVPYLEWKQSSLAAKNSCQSCHMPVASGDAKISTLSSQTHSPLSRHTFTGGNAYMLSLLKGNAQDLEITASGEQLDASIQRTTTQLQQQTAALNISAGQASGKLDLKVKVANLTGHKLPTAFPSRRAWLHVVVKDASGKVFFESGGWQADGSIIGNDNDQDPARFEPHYTLIQSPDQVQIYEAILKDLNGKVTTSVIQAASYLKDNRLLPAGFDKTKADPDTAVAGEALQDSDFSGGQDELAYQVALGGASDPFSVRVELVYQSIGYRWLQNLTSVKTDELETLLKATSNTPNTPIILSVQELEVK
jgi:hypothetical protein